MARKAPGGPQRRGTTDREELRAWSMMFRVGQDYLNRLKHLGFMHHRQEQRQALEDAAEEAWHRIGAEYLEAYGDKCHAGREEKLWALETFGLPGGK